MHTLALVFALHAATAARHVDPFAFFQPWVTISADDRRRLETGDPVAHTIPAPSGEVAVVAVIPIRIDGDRLVAWVRRIEELKKSPYVLAIGRFSDPPRLADLPDRLLDEVELPDVGACRPAGCGLKLSAAEMHALQHAAGESAVQMEFRRIILDRVQVYLAGRDVGPFEDGAAPSAPARDAATLVDHTGFLAARLPAFAARLSTPGARAAGAESFVYWSKEHIAHKAIISATDVTILRGDAGILPDVLVTGKQIFATHYMNASLGITALMRGQPGGPNYLVYVNRTQLDMLHGILGALIHPLVERRLTEEAATVLLELRRRLESGGPPRPERRPE